MADYGMRTRYDGAFAEAVEAARRELAREGFGVLTKIDVRKTLKEKLAEDFDNYVILGACNPPLARRALRVEREIGLLLPCNVIVHEEEGAVFISAIRPSVAMKVVDNKDLARIAREVEDKLQTVIGRLGRTVGT